MNVGTLRSIIQGSFTQGEDRLRVRDVASDRGWDWSKISMDIPLPIKLETQAIPYATTTSRPNKLAWANNPQGVFYFKSAYDIAIGSDHILFEG